MRGTGLWTTAAVAACLLAGAAHAQSLASARAFTVRLYAAYEGGQPDYLGRDARRIFAPHLLALIRRDEKATPSGEVGALDGDPICDCQDAEGVRATRVTVRATGAGRARATVILRFPSETRTLGLDLVAAGADWRVADVHTADTPSLVRLLEKARR